MKLRHPYDEYDEYTDDDLAEFAEQKIHGGAPLRAPQPSTWTSRLKPRRGNATKRRLMVAAIAKRSAQS
jgi:hypothetical protein